MDFRHRVTNAFKALQKNSYPINTGRGLAERFRRNGNDRIYSDWSQIVMNEQDKYTGYLYAAVNNRAKKVAMLGLKHVRTDAAPAIVDAAKGKDDPVIHPYLDVIDKSRTFSNYSFWFNISTFLDLKGRYYLFALRNKSGERTGDIQYFRLLNPYNIKRVVDEVTGEVQGYVEGKAGTTREIPKHMIIEINPLNPFSDDEPFSMTDAASESQFTLKTAADHTRHSISKNRATSGIITINDDDLALDSQRMENFKSRIMGKEKGEPIFGVGKGSISWNDMQIDLNKSALDVVSQVNLNQLIAVTGNSKTMFGHEESGGTKDRSDDQKNMFIDNHCIPQVQLIIDALNQDYKNYYETEYATAAYELMVDSPTDDDKSSEVQEQDVKAKKFDLYNALRNKGYSHEVAAKFADGEMELSEIGEPTEEPVTVVVDPTQPPQQPTDNHIEAIHNLFAEDAGVISQQQGALQNAVNNIEQQVVMAVMNKVTKNGYDEEKDIISASERKRVETELTTAIAAFYLVLVPLFARRTMDRRAKEFSMMGLFSVNTEVRKYIKEIAVKASQSHINTILDDLLKAVQKSALDGASQQELISAIRKEYTDISKNRAVAIARTETNRAFTQSQYQADKQFLKQNKLTGQAYKKWIVRSSNPCPLCLEMASRPPVPFKNDFLEFGSTLSVTYQDNDKTKVIKQTVDYEPLEAGNLHTNCNCAYQLIIEG